MPTANWTRHELVTRAQLGVALVGCALFPVAMLSLRLRLSDELSYKFLLWNLFLAGLPVAFAASTEVAWRFGRPWLAAASAAAWLAFFPNAPYVITDLVHLRERPPMPLWFDALILVSAGVAGLLAGFASLRLVHLTLEQAVGRRMAWLAALGVLALSGFGVYLGRFGRFNSWDLLTRPRTLLYEVGSAVQPLASTRTVAVTGLFAGFLVVSYLTLVAFANLSSGDSRGAPSRRVRSRSAQQ